MIERKILTSKEKNPILKLTIREFRNNFSKYWVVVEKGAVIVVYNRKNPILIVSPYKK
jgi:antitoxin (DNA-binding transcriptional repressor) of toxin-antitoxin stability system